MFKVVDASWDKNKFIFDCETKFLKGIQHFKLTESLGFFKTGVEKLYPLSKIVQIGVIDEENIKEKKFTGSAVGAGVGGLLLGPVGLIAGALAGGNKKYKIVKVGIKFIDEHWVIIELDTKDIADRAWLEAFQNLKVVDENTIKKAPF